MERAAEIYKNIANEDSKGAETAVSLSVKRVDYMSIYASNLVAAVRRAAGNIGTSTMLLDQCQCLEEKDANHKDIFVMATPITLGISILVLTCD